MLGRISAVAVTASLALGAVACGDDDAVVPDAGMRVDAGPVDAGPLPDGATPDAGGGEDAGMADAGMPPPCGPAEVPAVTTEVLTTDLNAPVFVTQAPGSTDTLWVVEQPGRILLFRDGALLPDPYLDITGRVDYGGERGLLGLAFHPDYATNGRFFVYYTPDSPNHNRVAEYRVSDDPDVASDVEVQVIWSEDDPFGNHNGGMIAFGPDGYLYAGMGDGGDGGDPRNLALNPNSPFGKLHRFDVDAEMPFVAEGNPFGPGGGLPTIWATGLRNPWRFSFDRLTGELYVGDVGQNMWEEINVAAPGAAGLNYGWRAYEAFAVFSRADIGMVETHHEPVLAVRHASDPLLRGAASITGGYVYRGSAIPGLQGFYLFGDYASNDVAAFRYCDGAIQGDPVRVPGLVNTTEARGVSSFGEDLQGELYITYLYGRDSRSGDLVKIVPAP